MADFGKALHTSTQLLVNSPSENIRASKNSMVHLKPIWPAGNRKRKKEHCFTNCFLMHSLSSSSSDQIPTLMVFRGLGWIIRLSGRNGNGSSRLSEENGLTSSSMYVFIATFVIVGLCSSSCVGDNFVGRQPVAFGNTKCRRHGPFICCTGCKFSIHHI